MIKARHIPLRLDQDLQEKLRFYQTEAARCWNTILVIAKDYYLVHDRKWIAKGDLQKQLKNQFKLHSQTVQALTDKFVANRDTAAELRRNGDKKAKYPWREKRFLTIPFKQKAIHVKADGTIRLSLENRVFFETGFKPSSKINTVEILWTGSGYALAYTSDYPVKDNKPGITAGIDIGEIHPVALCSEVGEGLVISGRAVRATKQWRNKSLAKLARRLSRCTKGSRQWKKLIRARGRLKSKTDHQVRDLLHKATRQAIDWCEANHVAELVIGNPKGVEKNTKKKRRLNKNSRQKVSQMEYGRIKKYLAYKAAEAGITSCLVNERDTSKNCPECGSENHVRGRVYTCSSCDFVGHRDGKAAFLILRKKHPELPTPQRFALQHAQCFPKYRKQRRREPQHHPLACVVDPDVILSRSAIARPLDNAFRAA